MKLKLQSSDIKDKFLNLMFEGNFSVHEPLYKIIVANQIVYNFLYLNKHSKTINTYFN